MAKRLLKVAVGLFLLVSIIVVIVLVRASSRFTSVYEEVHPDPSLNLRLENFTADALEGARIAQMKGCFDCHGTDMAGNVVADDPMVGRIAGPNLTPGGVGKEYGDQDWVRSIRYGIGRNKRYLRFMPSDEYAQLTDQDLAHVIAYLKAVPASEKASPEVVVGPMAKVLYSFGKMPLMFPGERVSAAELPPVKLEPSESAEYGAYLAAACTGCHRPDYTGGPIAGVPPDWPPAANLSKSGDVQKWTLAQFKTALTQGKTPNGKLMNSTYMPWKSFSAMNDSEIKAIFAFLQAQK